MKKMVLIISACVLVAGALIAANVSVKQSGPSGQGDIIYYAPATAVTNMVMGTGGLYNVTLDPRYPITGVSLLPGNLTLANTYMVVGNASAVGAALTPAAVRTNLSLVIGTDVQAYDSDLTTWAGISPSANAQALLLLTYAAMRTNLTLVVGTDVQAYDADLTTWAGITPSANAQALLLLTYAAMRTNLTLVIGTDVQAYDAQLDTWSGVTPSADGQALVALANYATMRTNIVGAGTVTASMIDPTVVTNVLAAGMILPAVDGSAVTNMNASELKSGSIPIARIAAGGILAAVDGSAVTNIAGGNIASGNIAEARITNALATAVIPLVGITNALATAVIPQTGITNALATAGSSIGGNIPLVSITNALSGTLYSGTYTNDSTLGTNTIVVLNGVIVSVTRTP